MARLVILFCFLISFNASGILYTSDAYPKQWHDDDDGYFNPRLLRTAMKSAIPDVSEESLKMVEEEHSPAKIYELFITGLLLGKFDDIRYCCSVIFSNYNPDIKLKQAVFDKLYEYRNKSEVCRFEMGKVIYYGKINGGNDIEKGLEIIRESANKGFKKAIYFMIDFYRNNHNIEAMQYYLEMLAEQGEVNREYVYILLNKNFPDEAYKNFVRYIEGRKKRVEKFKTIKATFTNTTREEIIKSMNDNVDREIACYNRLISEKIKDTEIRKRYLYMNNKTESKLATAPLKE